MKPDQLILCCLGVDGANRILWHFVAPPVGLNQFCLQKQTQIYDFTGFP